MKAVISKPGLVALVALSLLVGPPAAVPAAAVAEEPTITPIEFPGASQTSAGGINARGDIVGSYRRCPLPSPPGCAEPDRQSHGFLLRGGTFTSIDVPGAMSTQAHGISPGGDIVGNYDPPCCPAGRLGFVLRGGTFTLIHFPGSIFTDAFGINPHGDVVGRYAVDNVKTGNGFVLRAGTFTPVHFPGAILTDAAGINPRGDIVGNVIMPAGIGGDRKVHGFLLSQK